MASIDNDVPYTNSSYDASGVAPYGFPCGYPYGFPYGSPCFPFNSDNTNDAWKWYAYLCWCNAQKQQTDSTKGKDNKSSSTSDKKEYLPTRYYGGGETTIDKMRETLNILLRPKALDSFIGFESGESFLSLMSDKNIQTIYDKLLGNDQAKGSQLIPSFIAILKDLDTSGESERVSDTIEELVATTVHLLPIPNTENRREYVHLKILLSSLLKDVNLKTPTTLSTQAIEKLVSIVNENPGFQDSIINRELKKVERPSVFDSKDPNDYTNSTGTTIEILAYVYLYVSNIMRQLHESNSEVPLNLPSFDIDPASDVKTWYMGSGAPTYIPSRKYYYQH